jgi:peroxiredoxin
MSPARAKRDWRSVVITAIAQTRSKECDSCNPHIPFLSICGTNSSSIVFGTTSGGVSLAPEGERRRRCENEEDDMSLINTEIKPFKATAFHAGKFVEVSEATLKGKWSVVFFYPADFTFVCPTELKDLAANYEAFKKLGVEIYAVSTDTHFCHKAWHDTSPAIGEIKYPMVGDPTGAISRNFDVLIESAGLADRGTFVIDPDGKIQIIEINAGNVGRNALELLRKIKAAQYVAAHQGEVCPAKWQEGEKTLAPSLDLVGKI